MVSTLSGWTFAAVSTCLYMKLNLLNVNSWTSEAVFKESILQCNYEPNNKNISQNKGESIHKLNPRTEISIRWSAALFNSLDFIWSYNVHFGSSGAQSSPSGWQWLTSWHMTQFWLISLMDATQRQICYLLIYPFWVLILATWVYASFKITLYLITKYESTYLELWTLQLWVIINK